MGVLANGTLAAAIWFTIVIKRPFTLDYAKEHTDASLPSAWGASLTANAALAFGKMLTRRRM